MKQEFKVEIRGQKNVYYFETEEEATDYAITSTAWTGGQYRITPVIVATEEAK